MKKILLLISIVFISAGAYSQQAETFNQIPAYNQTAGRYIEAPVFKQYVTSYPEYAAKCNYDQSTKMYLDKNDLSLILDLQQRFNIIDKELALIINNPANATLINEINKVRVVNNKAPVKTGK
jgi:hypothetical protein